MSARGRKLVVSGLVLAFGVAACSSGGGTLPGLTTLPPPTESPDTTVVETTLPEPAGTGAVDTLEGVQAATIQIEARGTIRDPELGMAWSGGRGSGFLVSPDGLAVTNNHVVTGAATLEVFIGGDPSRSYNAQVLGVSECNDLAVIKVNVSEVPFLDWYDGSITPGLDVYAAGFPFGDPEYTLTRGIVSKARAAGDTPWASIDFTIEHDAAIQPGNSGGPLVTSDGQVVAVNYATGDWGTGQNQFFAISAELARPVADRLRDGDFESLGINGLVVAEGDFGGLWVAGVDAGSPAAQARILPGDIVTMLNGLPIGLDGTYKDYCDVIRTAGSRPIAVEVLRYDTSEVLVGEINGDRPLEVSISFAEQLGNQTDLGTGQAYGEYRTITDDLGLIVVDAPVAWGDLDTEPFELDDGSLVPYIGVSPDLRDYFTSFETPGMEMAVLTAAQLAGRTTTDLLETFAPPEGACEFDDSGEYADAVFEGVYDLWVDCDGIGTIYAVLVAYPIAGNGSAFIIVFQAVTDADLDVLERVLDTFNFT